MFNLKKIRKENKITQQELAKRINTTQSNISGWESLKWEPDMEAVKDICKVLNCSSDYLLGLTNYDYKVKNNEMLTIKDPLEEELVELFNQLDFGNKNQVIGYIRSYVTLQNQNKLKK